MSDLLTTEQKDAIRKNLVANAAKLLGIPYRRGAEWTHFDVLPEELDCSEMVEGVYTLQGLKMPDGSWNQFAFTVPAATPKIGDLAFFGRGGRPNEIYHSGIVYDDFQIIECRDFDPNARFETGRIILRPRKNWEAYKNFVGYRAHPKLL